ncbi:MAG: DUF2569 domain-containing protein [Pseudomonadota bacterium]|nr:DUF2569 domain-containing protein [Pseudomonadota bacterium]
MFVAVGQHLHSKSVAMLGSIEGGLPRIMRYWLVAALVASALRIAISPLQGVPDFATMLPYLLLVIAPLVSMGLALHWFADGDRQPQPAMRLARLGRWRTVPPGEARRDPLYGTTGLMVSLLIGILLNVPVRALEYLAIMPALAGPVPEWLSVLHLMTTIDVILLTSLYTIAFVAALRKVALFPRLLAAIWVIDLAMQMAIAETVAATPGLPPAVATSLHQLLDGNVHKVLISIAIWLPYLLMSRRVNITYRSRVPA